MADLTLLKEVGEELLPVFENLVDLVGKDKDADNKPAVRAVIQKLRRLVQRADRPTRADLAARSAAIYATRHALSTLLREAARNPNVALRKTQARIMENQVIALRDAHGRLLEMQVFHDIAVLLSDAQIERISSMLDGAQQEIAARQKAKEIFDTTIKVAIAAAKIAAKVA